MRYANGSFGRAGSRAARSLAVIALAQVIGLHGSVRVRHWLLVAKGDHPVFGENGRGLYSPFSGFELGRNTSRRWMFPSQKRRDRGKEAGERSIVAEAELEFRICGQHCVAKVFDERPRDSEPAFANETVLIGAMEKFLAIARNFSIAPISCSLRANVSWTRSGAASSIALPTCRRVSFLKIAQLSVSAARASRTFFFVWFNGR
jgi:hypothetical protein